MAQRPSFADGLKGLSKAAGKPEPVAPPAPAPTVQPPPARAPGEGSTQPPSRQGKVTISGYFDPAVRKQLAIMAVHGDTSQAALLAEALNLLFEKHGQPPIARA